MSIFFSHRSQVLRPTRSQLRPARKQPPVPLRLSHPHQIAKREKRQALRRQPINPRRTKRHRHRRLRNGPQRAHRQHNQIQNPLRRLDQIQRPPFLPLHQDPLPPRRQRDPLLPRLRAHIRSSSRNAQDPTLVEDPRR